MATLVEAAYCLPVELEPFMPIIENNRDRIMELSDPPVTPDDAFKIAAQGVLNWVKARYADAIAGATPLSHRLQKRLAEEGNWPPQDLPDFM